MRDEIKPNIKNIKLVVSDLDGTLLGMDKKISDENYKAIQKLKEKGILFSICTGRIATMIEPYVKALNIEIPVITTNGALIWDPVKQKEVKGKTLDQEEAFTIINYCIQNNLEYCVLTLSNNYFNCDNFLMKRFRRYNEIALEQNLKPMKLLATDFFYPYNAEIKIYKILIYSDDAVRLKEAKQFIKDMKNTGVTSSEHGLLDIMNIKANKGSGVQVLIKELGLCPEEVCAFGDFDNDISMFQTVGLSVAMDNAQPLVKKSAKYVTKSNEENGVAWFLKNYILKDK